MTKTKHASGSCPHVTGIGTETSTGKKYQLCSCGWRREIIDDLNYGKWEIDPLAVR